MTTTDMPKKKVHEGRNVRRLRDTLEVKQDVLASKLQELSGEEWNQRRVSWLESKEIIPADLKSHVAMALGVPVKAIENFSEEAAVNYFNTFEDTVTNNGAIGCSNYDCNFNPLEKYAETVEKNEKLYEALLKEKQEKIELLERLLGTKQ